MHAGHPSATPSLEWCASMEVIHLSATPSQEWCTQLWTDLHLYVAESKDKLAGET